MTTGCVQANQIKGGLKLQALHELLNLVVNFKQLLDLAQRTVVSKEAWTQLLKKSKELREHLMSGTRLAEGALGGAELILSLKTVVHIGTIIKAWPEHSKREDVLNLFNLYAIDTRIGNLIDKTLSENRGDLVGLLNLDLRAELVVMLESQVERLISQLRALEQCLTEQEKQAVLHTLLPVRLEGLENSVLSVNDFELTVCTVATLALLRPT